MLLKKSIQEQPGHSHPWAEKKTGKDNFPCFSSVTGTVEPHSSTHYLLRWDFPAVVGYGGDTPDCRWERVSGDGQHLLLTLPKEPSKGEALREACVFLWLLPSVKHPQQKKRTITTPQVYGRKKIRVVFQGEYFKSHSQFASRYSGCIV